MTGADSKRRLRCPLGNYERMTADEFETHLVRHHRFTRAWARFIVQRTEAAATRRHEWFDSLGGNGIVRCPKCRHEGVVGTIVNGHITSAHPKLSARERSALRAWIRRIAYRDFPYWRVRRTRPSGFKWPTHRATSGALKVFRTGAPPPPSVVPRSLSVTADKEPHQNDTGSGGA